MQKIRNYIQDISKSRFVKNLGITLFENIFTKFLGFFITLIIVRQLGPENYGIYSFILVNVFTLSALVDFGMENTAIRFSNRDKNKQNAIFGLYFLTKLIIVFSCIFIFGVFGQDILLKLHKPELVEYLPFFICGFLGESLFFVNDTYLQSIQQFKIRAIINITRYIVLFSFIGILFLNKIVLLKYVSFVFIIPLIFILFFIPRYLIFIKSFYKQKLSKILFIKIIKYQKWMFILAIVASLLGRIDVYMLSFLVDYEKLGIYSAAYNLLSIVAFLPFVLGKVMLPKMAETSRKNIFGLTIKITKPILFLSLISLFAIPIFPYLVPILFGNDYDNSIVIVQILTIATIISFISLPVEVSMYNLGKPKYLVLFKYIQLIFIIVFNLIMIPRYGIICAAISIVMARIVHAMLLYFVFVKEKKKYA